jgi:hypothetical protein
MFFSVDNVVTFYKREPLLTVRFSKVSACRNKNLDQKIYGVYHG